MLLLFFFLLCLYVLYPFFLFSEKKEKEPWEMIGSERVQAAERKKDEGNVLFKNGKYQRALKKYDKVPFTALEYLTFMWLFLDELAIVDNLTLSRLQHMSVKTDAMKMTIKSLSNL